MASEFRAPGALEANQLELEFDLGLDIRAL
jgi:hypothetical protein